MIIIKYKLLIIMFFSLVVSIPITSHADTAESRATKIISLTAESEEDNKESSIKEQSELFIQDLRKKYPHFSEEQLQSMQRAYEDTVLENVTAPQIAVKKEEVQADLTLKETPTKKKLPRKIEQFVSSTANKKVKTKEIKNIKAEAKNTVISLTVKKGDTLSDIAKREYGDPNMYIAIYEENKDKLRSPRSVPAGITLRVPKIDSSMKEKFAKIKMDYEKNIAEEKRKKREKRRKLKEEQQVRKRKERKKERERINKEKERADKKEAEEKKKMEEASNSDTKVEKERSAPRREKTREQEEDKTYKSMEELQRLILEGKY